MDTPVLKSWRCDKKATTIFQLEIPDMSLEMCKLTQDEIVVLDNLGADDSPLFAKIGALGFLIQRIEEEMVLIEQKKQKSE